MSMKAPGNGVSVPGADGASAYAIAVQQGFVGSPNQWLASLVGPQGPIGNTGNTGTTGSRGNTISAGSGAPSAPGLTGDLYIDTATGNLWQF